MIADIIASPVPGQRAQRGYGWAVFRRNSIKYKGDVMWWPLLHTTRNSRREAIEAYNGTFVEPGQFKRDEGAGKVRLLEIEIRIDQ